MDRFNYNPQEQGAITAIRIYYAEDNITPMAQFAFAYGETATIEWTNPVHRNSYANGINGYTLIFDEREKADFQNFVRVK